MSDVDTQADLLTITIDGKDCEAEPGSMIIEAADKAGIVIPRFCYHKKLSVAANCRMCLVDVENARKPSPACATPVTEGMAVSTKSKKALSYQKAVMEFLLINHPLDCPICDQGGECELQDVAMGYGKDVSRFNEGKRAVPDKDIGPLISTDLTRCIHCTRCVRFGTEIAGMTELGMLGRGEHSEIGTFLEKSVDSEMSGNVIDLCPVGALTSKPYRFRARPWEMEQKRGIAGHDCVGSQVNGHVRRQSLLRVVPEECESLNEVWLSDRDRFSYEGLTADNRLTQPMIKQEGEWITVDWAQALDYCVEALSRAKDQHGAEKIGALVSSSATVEEQYLLAQMLQHLGSGNIDYRARHQNFETSSPYFEGQLEDVSSADAILIVGSHLRREQPIIHHRVNRAALSGAKVMAVNPSAFDAVFELDHCTVVDADELLDEVAEITTALYALNKEDSSHLPEWVTAKKPSAESKAIAEALNEADAPVLLTGMIVEHHPQSANIEKLVALCRRVLNAKGGMLTCGANAQGAWMAGCVPGENALNAGQMCRNDMAAMCLLGVDPVLDTAYGQEALTTLSQAFVISLSAYKTDALDEVADVLLPIGTCYESEGSFVNAFGDVQHFQALAQAPGDAKPAWKVVRLLTNFLESESPEYNTQHEVFAALSEQRPHTQLYSLPDQLEPSEKVEYIRVAEVPLYQVDGVVRAATSLQKTHIAQSEEHAVISEAVAQRFSIQKAGKLNFIQAGREVTLPVRIDERLAPRTVLIPMGHPYASALTDSYGPLDIKAAGE